MDAPQAAVTGAQTLVSAVMEDRGYPTEPYDQTVADLSVEHASTLDHFRAAHDISQNAAAGTASTEDLRQAMIHYRALFAELLGEPASDLDGRDREPARRHRAVDEPAAAADEPAAATAVDETSVDQPPVDQPSAVDQPGRGGPAAREPVARRSPPWTSPRRPGPQSDPRRRDHRAPAGKVTQMTSQRDETAGHMTGDDMTDDPIVVERHDEILGGPVDDPEADDLAADDLAADRASHG